MDTIKRQAPMSKTCFADIINIHAINIIATLAYSFCRFPKKTYICAPFCGRGEIGRRTRLRI